MIDKTTIICNKCGKEFDIWDMQENFTLTRNLGYGTTHDGETLQIHMCCECMEKLIEECAVSPIVNT